MFAALLDEDDRQRVAAERKARTALDTLCERAPLKVLQWVGALLERVCARLQRRDVAERRAA